MEQYVCTLCGHRYDEADADEAGNNQTDALTDFVCPMCGACNADYKLESADTK